MTAALILFVLQASIVLSVLSLGLGTSLTDPWYLFGRRRQVVRSLFSMNIAMPLFASTLAVGSNLYPAVKFALIMLAISPMPPMLPKRQLKAGARASYVFGLLVAAALFAIVFVPVAVAVLGKAFGKPLHTPAGTIAKILFAQILIPLAAGIALRESAPEFAERIAKRVALLAAALLVVAGVPLLFFALPVCLPLIGNGTLAVLVAFCLGGLATGHVLGGPEAENRTVLALSTASRHPAAAITIANANFPEEKTIFGALLLYLIVSTILSAAYLAWLRRQT
jgi:bile acid:Na+ symporter, BASS family